MSARSSNKTLYINTCTRVLGEKNVVLQLILFLIIPNKKILSVSQVSQKNKILQYNTGSSSASL